MIAHDSGLRASIAGGLARHTRRPIEPGELRRAAVAIVLVDSEAGVDEHDPYSFSAEEMAVVPGDITGLDGSVSGVAGGSSVLLCRRAARLNRHGGQWALPGGRCDEGESAIETALRELHEELGVAPEQSEVLGILDDYETRSGYVVTPVVLWTDGHVDLQPDPGEVAHVYRIGLPELMRPDSPRFVTIPESDRPVVQMPIGRDLLHAPTAAMLLQFRYVCLEGKPDARVHDLEQPVFAWR
ncbi:MAG: hypothetical protein RLZ04_2422 [Actinomycetota bacterium]